MNQKLKLIVLSAVPYSITEGNEKNEGISIWYLFSGDLSPFSDEDSGTKGLVPCKCSVPLELAPSFVSLPALYDVSFVMRTVKNKPSNVPVAFDFISNIEIKGGGK